ncbi:MAG TPA: hypothetical protein VIC32_05545 [Terriglobales bacterium]|jgi:hypothetical protein
MALLWKHQARQCRLEQQLATQAAEHWKRECANTRERLALADNMIASLRQKIETLTDNVLFGSGHAPLYQPDAPRFQPRQMVEQQAEARQAARALSPAEWRRRAEELDRQQAERNRRAELAEGLKQLARDRAARREPAASQAEPNA